ncbi:MAG: ABC transporter permease subunit [Planctomycetes bacterium]|nr:ABC transporter permease subunit [Planctomycetota bacterium]
MSTAQRTALDLDRLRRERPRSRLARASLLGLVALVAYSWLGGDIALDDLFSTRRAENLARFLAVDAAPHALRGTDWGCSDWLAFAHGLWQDRGYAGLLQTLAISVLAIVLAGIAALGGAFLAARNVASPTPFGDAGRPGWPAWRVVAPLVRAWLVLLRAVPEYVWAFLLLAMLGPNAWPAVLALAIHNAGILGKLGAETVENLDPRPLSAWRSLGASRAQGAWLAALPLAANRYLLYFFYRFETCVREATVLGMLGVVSLGYWIQDSRAKQFYDEMLAFVVLGAGLVLAADLASALVRRALRRGA